MQDTQQLDVARSHWVKVMADYSATGLWDSTGVPLEHDEVPISLALRERLSAWCNRYELNEDYLPGAEGSFDYAGFSADGLAIAKALKTELPDWTVVYFDEREMRAALAKQISTPERASYEFEVSAD
jgi:hypothetical protein